MTFDDAHRLIKKGDIVCLRHELSAGVLPDLANQFSWTFSWRQLKAIRQLPNFWFSRGTDIHLASDFGDTAISLALRRPYSTHQDAACSWGFQKLPSTWDNAWRLDEGFVGPSCRQDSVGHRRYQRHIALSKGTAAIARWAGWYFLGRLIVQAQLAAIAAGLVSMTVGSAVTSVITNTRSCPLSFGKEIQ
jgi:hypothetical protein